MSDTFTSPPTMHIQQHAQRKAWLYLLLASVFEIIFALGTNASQGFTLLWPSLLTIFAASCGIFFLSLALRKIDVGVGYTVWVGIGSVGTVLFGTLIFSESISWQKVLCFALIIGGIIGLKLADHLSFKLNKR